MDQKGSNAVSRAHKLGMGLEWNLLLSLVVERRWRAIARRVASGSLLRTCRWADLATEHTAHVVFPCKESHLTTCKPRKVSNAVETA